VHPQLDEEHPQREHSLEQPTTASPPVAMSLSATQPRTLGLASSTILETKPAWGTTNGISRNDHAPKMLRDTGGEKAQQYSIELNSRQ
jgi:hypothetical protein